MVDFSLILGIDSAEDCMTAKDRLLNGKALYVDLKLNWLKLSKMLMVGFMLKHPWFDDHNIYPIISFIALGLWAISINLFFVYIKMNYY